VGCAFRCRFCATGRLGLTRNLSPGETVDQVNFVRFYLAESNSAEQGRGQPTRPFRCV
ncbi:MAG TPA: 23S rRNA (adenine(2503)-C(2))-methyltransferase RlmN, partial [Firmicutes bacterium]|nr:23S rRNA (adenine(2503)-C(2))-methyltransferase RlmN [Bacillota bacterium]